MQHRIISREVCARLSDVEIVERSVENLDYFSCLYIRYGPMLLNYIKRISSLKDQEAEDILQDALIKAWRNLNAYQPNLKLSSWLYRIVHNETISYWRKKKSFNKDLTVSLDEGEGKYFQAEQGEMSTDAEKWRIMEQVLNRMPINYREVLMLKFLENMSYEEISDILKIPEGTVATRINRAKKAFKKIARENQFHFEL